MRQPKRLGLEQLYWQGVKALAVRARSIGELRRLLARRAEKKEDVAAVVSRLKERGYLNDNRFAEYFAAARIENQRLGRVRVLRDLRARLVAPEVAERAAKKAYAGIREEDLLRQRLERDLRRRGPPKTPQKTAALYRSLRRAGFSHTAIAAELRRLRADADLLDALAGETSEGEAGDESAPEPAF